ncbi:MAG TPA: ATP-binding protein, partial [Longimicrobium sp.]|nr:ATP-binding protein [Longimicrobium sp.]
LIADVFFCRGIIEQWGRGTLKIIEITEQAGLVKPEFEVRGGEVVVRFRPQGYVPPSRVSRDLSALQREILVVLADGGPQSLTAVLAKLSVAVPRSTAVDNLRLLKQLGLVELTGRTRGARWGLASSA